MNTESLSFFRSNCELQPPKSDTPHIVDPEVLNLYRMPIPNSPDQQNPEKPETEFRDVRSMLTAAILWNDAWDAYFFNKDPKSLQNIADRVAKLSNAELERVARELESQMTNWKIVRDSNSKIVGFDWHLSGLSKPLGSLIGPDVRIEIDNKKVTVESNTLRNLYRGHRSTRAKAESERK